MRWKLVFATSLIAALAGFGIWLAVTLAAFGSASALTKRPIVLVVSLGVPLAFAASASVFAYRHTSRRRKLQAFLAAILSLFLTAASYLVVSLFAPSRLYVPRTFDMRHSR
jgi:hypothetical protein